MLVEAESWLQLKAEKGGLGRAESSEVDGKQLGQLTSLEWMIVVS